MGIDVASSIKVVDASGDESYHPLLICVKNWATESEESFVLDWQKDLEEFLEEMRGSNASPSAVCLMILLGCPEPPDINSNGLNLTDLSSFPEKDAYRLVTVPESDKFGVSDAIKTLGEISEASGIYTSHGFLRPEKNSSSLLGKNSQSEANQKYVNELFDAIHASDSNE